MGNPVNFGSPSTPKPRTLEVSDAVRPDSWKNSDRTEQETNNANINTKRHSNVQSRRVADKSRNTKQGGNKEKSDTPKPLVHQSLERVI